MGTVSIAPRKGLSTEQRPTTTALYRRGVPQPPARKLVEWTEDAGPVEDWLARWAVSGWAPELGYGVPTEIGGRHLVRWAMIQASPPDEGQHRPAEPSPFGNVAPEPDA